MVRRGRPTLNRQLGPLVRSTTQQPTVVDHNARGSELLPHLLEESRHGLRLGQIDRKVLERFGGLFRRPRRKSDLVACLDKLFRDRLTDTSSSAEDKGDG